MNWADKTKWRLEQLGWSIRVLADNALINYGYVKAALNAKSEPGSANGIKIAIALGFDPTWLFDDEQDLNTVKYMKPNESSAAYRVSDIDNLFDNKDLMLMRDLKATIEFLGPGDQGIIDLYRIALAMAQAKIDRVDNALRGSIEDDTLSPVRNIGDKLHDHR